MRHPKILEWEHQIKSMFDDIDDWLEKKYGATFPLHPNRPERGMTANKEMDGLFNVGADFTTGYGSKLGRGYIVNIRMSTLEHIPENVRQCIEEDVEDLVREKLPLVFPNRALRVERDGKMMKIIGDFRLGAVAVE